MPSLLQDFFGGLAAVALALGLCQPSYLVARALLPAARPATRLSGAVAVMLWLAATLFWLLALVGLFRLPVTLVVLAGLGWWAHHRLDGRGAASAWTADVRAIGSELGRAGRTVQALTLATAGLALLGLLRGTLAPPLGWDSLTYHLLKAGRFVQAGGLVAERAPDAWAYYEYFPFVGDIYWAWVMLPGRSDLWLTSAGTAVWAAVLLGVYALGRELGAGPRGAALAALATGAMPSLLVFLSSSYVDNTTLLLFVLGALFVTRALGGHGRLREAVLAAGSLGLMVGTKITTAPLFALGAVLAGWHVLRSGASARTRAWVLLGCLVAVFPGTPSYVRAWLEQGSPFFPFPVKVAGLTLSPGTEVMELMSHNLMTAKGWRISSPGWFWASFLWRPTDSGFFVNPGLGAVLLVLAGLAALPGLWRDRSRRSGVLWLVAGGLLVLGGFLSSSMELFRVTVNTHTAGRFVTLGFACAAALAATLGGRAATFGLAASTVLGLAWSIPRGWLGVETGGVLGLLGLALAQALGSWLLLRRRRPHRVAVGGLVLLLALGAAGAEVLRARWRYPLWEAAARPQQPLFHMHPLHAAYTSAWPIWQALDDGTPHRLAVTAGWDGLGHNGYRAPLLGSRLQNLVLYVPITADGSIVDNFKPDEVEKRADFKAWVARLAAARIDYVVSLGPRWTIEDHWMTTSPQLFEKTYLAPNDLHVAFRFRREALVHSP